MLKRLIVGLVLGSVIGAVVAAVLVQGLGMAVFSTAVFAYLAAAATGVIAGLVAGKPIWSSDGKIEAGLKAFFGVLLGLGAMFALRTWGKIHVDLTSLRAGAGYIGDLPAAALPLLAAVLSGFYELDNSPGSADAGEKKDEGAKAGAPRKAGGGAKVRVAEAEESEELDELEEPSASAKKKGR